MVRYATVMQRKRLIVPIFILVLLAGPLAAERGDSGSTDPWAALRGDQLAGLDRIIPRLLREGKIPGAVVLVGNREGTVYIRAFGNRTIVPRKVPMETDTIFDLASVTKGVATSTAVMQLVEKGRLSLDDKVSDHWPGFARNGKNNITVGQLMTHYSGLRPDLDVTGKWEGYAAAMTLILEEKPIYTPGSRYIYSDINFEILSELVRRISGKPFDEYCNENIFGPLGMKDTGFNPSTALQDRIAPTQFRKRKLLCGRVHDQTCDKMGGVAGHAGLFSTADDLAVFARALLNGGRIGRARILESRTIDEMTRPQSPPGKPDLRGLGWEIDPPFVSNRDELPPVGACGHMGFTGTALWIDPVTGTYIIVLTNRVHPNGIGSVKALRESVKKAVSRVIGPLSPVAVVNRRPSLRSFYQSFDSRKERTGKKEAGKR